MTLSKLTEDLNKVQALDDQPNANGGLTAAQLKTVFDDAGNAIKDFINDILTEEIADQFATQEQLADVLLGDIPDGSLTYVKLTPAPSSAATANAIVKYDANGRSQFADPSADQDAVTKLYALNYFSNFKTNEYGITFPGAMTANDFVDDRSIEVGAYVYFTNSVGTALWRFNPTTRAFTVMSAPAPVPNTFKGFVTNGTDIFALYSSSLDPNSSINVLKYSISGNSWSTFYNTALSSYTGNSMSKPSTDGTYMFFSTYVINTTGYFYKLHLTTGALTSFSVSTSNEPINCSVVYGGYVHFQGATGSFDAYRVNISTFAAATLYTAGLSMTNVRSTPNGFLYYLSSNILVEIEVVSDVIRPKRVYQVSLGSPELLIPSLGRLYYNQTEYEDLLAVKGK